MATQGGGGGMSGLLQNIAAIAQIRQMQDQLLVQQEQVANQRRETLLQGYGQYLDLIRQSPDPSVHDEVDVAFVDQGFDAEALRSLRESVAPEAGVLGTSRAVQGIKNATSNDLAAIDLAAASRETAGLSPGALASDTFIRDNLAASDLSPEARERLGFATQVRVGSGMDVGSYERANVEGSLPYETRQQMALIRGDVALGATGQAQANTSRMGLDLGWAQHRSQERLGQAAQTLQSLGLGIEISKLGIAQQQGRDPLPTIEALNATLGKLTDTKVPKSKLEKDALARTASSEIAILTDMGVYEPQGYVVAEVGPDGSVLKQYTISHQQMQGTQLRPNQRILQRIPHVLRADDIAKKGFSDYMLGH